MLIGADGRILQNGRDRNTGEQENRAFIRHGREISYVFDTPQKVAFAKLIFDSDLLRTTYDMHPSEKHHAMRCNQLDYSPLMHMPKTLVKNFELIVTTALGEEIVHRIASNKKRSVLIPIEGEIKKAVLKITDNWGETEESGVFTFELYEGDEFTEKGCALC